MKHLLFLLLFSATLFSFDFSLPPVFEEVMGEEEQMEPVKREPRQEDEASIYGGGEYSQGDVYAQPQGQTYGDVEIEYSDYPKIALLAPRKVIGKYTNALSDSILSYLIYKDKKFQYALFDSGDESEENITMTLSNIKQKGYQLVIAAVTQKGAKVIVRQEHQLPVFIPTINKKEVRQTRKNIYFGGIDYEEQIDKLLGFAGDRVAILGDKSALSRKLEKYVENASFSEIVYRKAIRNTKASLASIIKENEDLNESSIFLNMPIVSSSLVASQLNVYEAGHKNVLLTQISYNPLLFTLTQAKDREDMYIANSIGYTDDRLKDINMILGSNVDFAWVNYATLLGVDYLTNKFIYQGEPNIFSENMVNNQVRYQIELLKSSKSSFEKIKPTF